MPPRRPEPRRPQRTNHRTIVIDTGPLVAVVNNTDDHHDRCREWFASVPDLDQLIVPTVVLTEVSVLLQRKYGVATEARFVKEFADDLAAGAWTLHEPTPEVLARAAELMTKYANFRIGLVDAVVVATAESLDTPYVASVEDRYLPHVRPAHVQALTLLPPRA